jgi:hypothetical protein
VNSRRARNLLVVPLAVIAGSMFVIQWLSPAAAAGGGGTTASVSGSTVTIAVNIDICCAHDAAEQALYGPLIATRVRSAEGVWNFVLRGLPYKGCMPLKVAFTVRLLNAGDKPDAGYHQIAIDFTKPGRSAVYDPVAKRGDSTSAYTSALDGSFYYNSMDVRAWEHEIGHLMGLDDDYTDVISFSNLVPGGLQGSVTSNPLPGREETLMDTGNYIDQPLADRIGDLAAKAGLKMPQCWNGMMHVTVRVVTGAGTCEGTFDANVGLHVLADGKASGVATVTQAPINSCGKTTFALVGQTLPVSGQLSQSSLSLQIAPQTNQPLTGSLQRTGNSASGTLSGQVPIAGGTIYSDATVTLACATC